MGCYMDKKDDRVLTNMLTSDSMTPLVCAAHCSGYPYFATQYGNEVKLMIMKEMSLVVITGERSLEAPCPPTAEGGKISTGR